MSQRTNIIFIKKQLQKYLLEKMSIDNVDRIIFYIEFDEDEKQEPKTNFDEIMTHWVLPEIIGKPLNLDEVSEKLVTAKNEIPLWIKIRLNKNGNVIFLYISKRFRKRKIIDKWHESNEYKPLIEFN